MRSDMWLGGDFPLEVLDHFGGERKIGGSKRNRERKEKR